MKTTKLPSGEYVDIDLNDYLGMSHTTYTGGATWLGRPGIMNVSYVVPVMTPVEIRKELEAGKTVRATVKRFL